ncbi:hypothetical protein J8N05_31495 [Streptomyces sp. BH-SS-21]|uniref:Uncharacterized protein n=1 Tax=Streptomyces liliiviolaceus TaxID=2823109 RepID=A0A940Y475_9ACTN|nr:hypothetical protein [Streptomyces liliiviolaceus]MBQ0852696.1 hypothetical protein [Streptomyces liliiviolaceus]
MNAGRPGGSSAGRWGLVAQFPAPLEVGLRPDFQPASSVDMDVRDAANAVRAAP